MRNVWYKVHIYVWILLTFFNIAPLVIEFDTHDVQYIKFYQHLISDQCIGVLTLSGNESYLPLWLEHIAAKTVGLSISRYITEDLQVVSIMRDVKDPVQARQYMKPGPSNLSSIWFNITRRASPVDGILCHQEGILIPWTPFSLSQHKNTWVTSDKGGFEKWNQGDIKSHITLHFTLHTFFFLRKITLT